MKDEERPLLVQESWTQYGVHASLHLRRHGGNIQNIHVPERALVQVHFTDLHRVAKAYSTFNVTNKTTARYIDINSHMGYPISTCKHIIFRQLVELALRKLNRLIGEGSSIAGLVANTTGRNPAAALDEYFVVKKQYDGSNVVQERRLADDEFVLIVQSRWPSGKGFYLKQLSSGKSSTSTLYRSIQPPSLPLTTTGRCESDGFIDLGEDEPCLLIPLEHAGVSSRFVINTKKSKRSASTSVHHESAKHGSGLIEPSSVPSYLPSHNITDCKSCC